MFAVIKTGGKQYKVSSGDRLKVERLQGEEGEIVDLTSVLLINNEGAVSVGAPLLTDAYVRAEILEHTRNKKIIVFKKKRRKGYRRKAGHRQDVTVLQIQDIFEKGGDEKRAQMVSQKETKTSDQESVKAVKKTEKNEESAPKEKVQSKKAPAVKKVEPEGETKKEKVKKVSSSEGQDGKTSPQKKTKPSKEEA